VNDLLDLAKVEAGRLSVASAPANVSEAIDSALSLIQPQAESKKVEIVVIPGADHLPEYIGDDERVRQILVNLLSNAVKCTEPGGTVTVEASVTTTPDPRARLQPRNAHIRFAVADTGTGIPADKLRAIFEPFVQADSGPTRAVEGSGLGLTIGQKLARAMGGDITVVSELGKGSSFSLWLPANSSALTTSLADQVAVDTSGIDSGPGHASLPLTPRRELKGLGEVARGVMSQLCPLVESVVERVRCDPALAMATGLRTSQVANHLWALLSDIASALLVIEETAGESSSLLADAMEIQRLVSERHGAQRAALGWTEASLRREFMIVREELEHVVRYSVPPNGPIEAADAVAMVNRFIDQAEYLSVRSLEKKRDD
jgi:hypothetical protein